MKAGDAEAPGPPPGTGDMVTPSVKVLPAWQDYFSEEDLSTALRVLAAMNEEPMLKDWAEVDETFREFFRHGSEIFMPSKEVRRAKKKERTKTRKEKDGQLLSATGIRQKKQKAMDQYMYMLTPGADPLCLTSAEDAPQNAIEAPTAEAVQAAVGAEERSPVDMAESGADNKGTAETSGADNKAAAEEAGGAGEAEERAEPIKLHFSRKCCICGLPYFELHRFYDKMCQRCGDFNFDKREITADLTGRVAMVTGGRMKIGFAVALKLLRCGAFTIVTTRFPNDAALRFAAQADYNDWKDRVHVYGVDFRDIPALHRFMLYLKAKYDRLDIIINNAAQTVRKPPGFYRHLMAVESAALPTPLAQTVPEFNHQERAAMHAIMGAEIGGEPVPASLADSVRCPSGSEDGAVAVTDDGAIGAGVHRSAALSQMPLMAGDEVHDDRLFPKHIYDVDLQQVDMRTENSWTQTLAEVNSVELVECHAINAFAPFIITSELKPLMDRVPDVDKYIVQVSAMEGQFYRKNKTAKHPHTNMAKASLNMMVRTAAADYAKSNIYMNAVDTGWITDENPVHLHSERTEPPPLDDVDAAMRILDPVISGVNDPEKRVYGLFLKDYKPTRW